MRAFFVAPRPQGVHQTGSTPPPSAQKVTATFNPQALRLININIDADGDGMSDGELQATSEHPIWTERSSWTPANEIEAGDILHTDDERYVTVTDVSSEWGLYGTYNLSVANAHTFFVVVEGIPVLVHNAEYDIVIYGPPKPLTGNTPHHGVMDVWLEANMKGVKDVYGQPAYRGRSEKGFHCIELSPENHLKTRKVETDWRTAYNHKLGRPGNAKIDWTKVTPVEIQQLSRKAFDAAGVPPAVQERYFSNVHQWLWKKFCP